MKAVVALAIPMLLAGCGPATTGQVAPAAVPPPPRMAPPPQAPKPTPSSKGMRSPRIMAMAGLETVIGKPATVLTALFGPPKLTVREGDAVKLQFAGEACVLDVYLYPLGPGEVPTATYVDARRASDALDVDRAACVRALRR